MPPPSKGFPGLDRETAERFTSDVSAQEKQFIDALRAGRADENISLEELGFLIGISSGQLSRYASGECALTITNYLRIARALGYRPQVTWEKISDPAEAALPNMKVLPHKVMRSQSATRQRPLRPVSD